MFASLGSYYSVVRTYSSLAVNFDGPLLIRILIGVRGMRISCRYPDQCQGYAGTLQVSWPVLGEYKNWSA